MDLVFTNEQTIFRADEIIDYLQKPRFGISKSDYPDFNSWLEKVHHQLKSETKRSIIALSGGSMVGAIIYQKHQRINDTLEIKNVSVSPDSRGRLVASFLLRNAEIEGCKDFLCSKVIVDSKERNLVIKSLFLKNGYRIIGQGDLYGLDSGLDITYGKSITSSLANSRNEHR